MYTCIYTHTHTHQGIYINWFTLAFLLKIHAFIFSPEMGILGGRFPFSSGCQHMKALEVKLSLKIN